MPASRPMHAGIGSSNSPFPFMNPQVVC
uniref:Uncharacterized protein n=1 Tax=Anguilla anguilla TaxID=7936 RepID=A0A0E9PCR8_ANGAN